MSLFIIKPNGEHISFDFSEYEKCGSIYNYFKTNDITITLNDVKIPNDETPISDLNITDGDVAYISYECTDEECKTSWKHVLERGHELCIKQHLTNDYEKNILICENTIRSGNIDIIKVLLESGCPLSGWMCACAAEGCRLDILKWLHENECPWDEITCKYAAEGGQLDILQWARANGCPWDEYTCTSAVISGKLDILKWARENNCPWNEDTCSAAAFCGKLDILKWARENGCPWDDHTCKYATDNGHLEVLQWARANGCPE